MEVNLFMQYDLTLHRHMENSNESEVYNKCLKKIFI